ncbi:hypothetical protein BC567DRAFT_238341 [Phyllosticta citribraziliensis]
MADLLFVHLLVTASAAKANRLYSCPPSTARPGQKRRDLTIRVARDLVETWAGCGCGRVAHEHQFHFASRRTAEKQRQMSFRLGR